MMLGDRPQRRVVAQMMSQMHFYHLRCATALGMPSSSPLPNTSTREACGQSPETKSVIVLEAARVLAVARYTVCRCG